MFARLGRTFVDNAGDRRDDACVVQCLLRDAQGGLGLHDPRFGEFHLGLRQAQGCLSDDIRSFVNLKLVVGHGAFFMEAAVTLEVPFGLQAFGCGFFRCGTADRTGGARYGQILLGGGDRIALCDGIDLKQDGFSRFHTIPVIHPNSIQVAAGACGDIGEVLGLERALHQKAPFKVTRRDRRDLDRQHLLRKRCRSGERDRRQQQIHRFDSR